MGIRSVNLSAILGITILSVVLASAAFAPYLAPFDPTQPNLDIRFQPPGWLPRGAWDHPLGTDQVGRDILSRLMFGSRISIIVGGASVTIAGAIGITAGLVAGYFGGWWDVLLMRLADGFLSVPFLVLIIGAAGIIGPGLLTIILVLGVYNWVTFCRVVRGEVLSVARQEYVLAARAIGLRGWGILWRHIFPNIRAPVIVIGALEIATYILAESSLSFLGLGVQPPTVTWGGMLADGRNHLGSSWWLATFPGLAITITVLGVVFLGDWLRDALDPRLRGAGH